MDDRDLVVEADRPVVDLLEEVPGLLDPPELGVVAFDVPGERSESRLTSTSSITAEKIFSRRECREPTVTHTIWLRWYLADLSPSRIVAVLRPRLSWSTNSGE